MSLLMMGLLVGAAFAALKLLLGAGPQQTREPPPGLMVPLHSDYRQLRVEYHRTMDRSLPPRH